MKKYSPLPILLIFLITISPALAETRAPTEPLPKRVEKAEVIFLGKVTNKKVEGDWAKAELVVEEPLKNVRKGEKVEVIWRIKLANLRIYDTDDETTGVAILSDKHQGRYWLRSDKFEKPEKLDEVKTILEEAETES